MNPSVIRALTEMVAPVSIMLILCGSILGGMFLRRHFRLREKELELEASLHAHEAQARLRALETRQAAMEAALNAVAGMLQNQQQRAERLDAQLASPPPLAQPLQPGEVANVLALGPQRDKR